MSLTCRFALGLVVVLVLGTVQPASASTPATGVETVAALDPRLTQGRGAGLPFVEQEAENAATTGEIIGPDRRAR